MSQGFKIYFLRKQMWSTSLLKKTLFAAIAVCIWVAIGEMLYRIIIVKSLVFDRTILFLAILYSFLLLFLFRLERHVFRGKDIRWSDTMSSELALIFTGLILLLPVARSYPTFFLLHLMAVFATLFLPNALFAVIHAFLCLSAGVLPSDSLQPQMRMVLLAAGLVTVPLSIALKIISDETAQITRRLDHANWAASTLSNLTLKLDSTVSTEKRKAATEERQLMAQNLHDTVGHALTSLIALVDNLKNYELPKEAYSRVEFVENYLCDTLKSVREDVDGLRKKVPPWREEQDWTNNVHRLCDVFGECTQVNIQTQNLDLSMLPIELSEAIYHIVQEGLTNAFRHGHAANILISARLDTGSMTFMLKISDDGVGCKQPVEGNGLNGMKTRLAPFGGQLGWRSRERNGFDLAIEVPLAVHRVGAAM